jgi:hypothetical protein
MPKRYAATIHVEWGYDTHVVRLTARNWAKVKNGHSLRIRSSGFSAEGFQWEYWNFSGGLDGNLVVEYGRGGGVGFTGRLTEATIEEGDS